MKIISTKKTTNKNSILIYMEMFIAMNNIELSLYKIEI